jgi:hypothetical protein
VGFPIRKSTDQSFFAAPRGLSQRSTSFIASQRQGIHRTPLRHLIALIINAHSPRQVPDKHPFLPMLLGAKGSSSGLGTDRKTSLLRDRPAGRAVKRVQDMGVGLSSSLSTTAERSPLHDVRQPAPRNRNCVARIQAHGRAHIQGKHKDQKRDDLSIMTTSHLGSETWWSQTGSNRRPPACKAGALPAELWPR